MGDGRIGENAFYIVLSEGEQVAHQHGKNGDHGQAGENCGDLDQVRG